MTLYIGTKPEPPKNPCEGCDRRDNIGCKDWSYPELNCRVYIKYKDDLRMYQSFNLKPVDVEKLAEAIHDLIVECDDNGKQAKAKEIEQAINAFMEGK